MATFTDSDNFIIGREDAPISEVLSHLRSSTSFHLFHESWSCIANDLESPRTLVKRLRRDYLISTIGLADIVCEIVEEWVTRRSRNATLRELIRILEENGLNNCAEHLVKGLRASNQQKLAQKGQGQGFKRYCRVPPALQEFIGGTSTFAIVHTLDYQITCDKVSENFTNCCFHDWRGFIGMIGASNGLERKAITLDVVKECTLKNLKLLSKVCNNVKDIRKVVFVTSEDGHEVKELTRKLDPQNGNVELIADQMNWEDLTLAHQMEITERLEETYGIDVGEERFDGQFLVDLIQGRTLKLFNDGLPDDLSYYVQRRLLSRHVISPNIFVFPSPDVFLFSGIQHYELSKMVKDEPTSKSGYLQSRDSTLYTRFVLLEQPHHFERICNKTQEWVHLHLLHYDNGSFRWIRSRGPMTVFQNFIEVNNLQDESTEDELHFNLSSKVVCISGSPGMGKSVLLARIGRTLGRRFQERIIHFIVLREFIAHVKNYLSNNLISAIEATLKTTLCENPVAQAVLMSKLKSEAENEILIELLLDGFDEIDKSNQTLTYDIVQAIRSSFKSVRMWVTSRPHFLKELENNLNTLGFEIQPFSEEDQIQFLTSFWTGRESLNMTRIRQCASHCLNHLKARLGRKDADIAGIPMQCLLIGESYVEDALGYATIEGDSSTEIHLHIATISDLYLSLIEKKIEKYKALYGNENFDKSAILKMYARLSIELIFSKQFPQLEYLLPPIQISDLLKVGIVESRSGTADDLRFIHRTFAEFFTAWFVTELLGSGTGGSDELMHFLIEDIFESHTKKHFEFGGNEKEVSEFTHPVINYFIDSMIADTTHAGVNPNVGVDNITSKSGNSQQIFHKIAHACATSDFYNTFNFFDESHAFDKNESTIFTHSFVIHAIEHSRLDLVKLGLTHFENHHSFDTDIQIEALQAAAKIGKFTHVEYVVKRKGLYALVEDLRPGTETLLHLCVQHTKHNSERELDSRVQIMRMLVDINPQLLEKRDRYKRTPLLSLSVHMRLLIELLQLGANPYVQDLYLRTVLTQTQYSPKEYNTLLSNIPGNRLNRLFKLVDRYDLTPLKSVLLYFDPTEETIGIFKKFGADFNDRSEYTLHSTYPALATAIRCGRNASTLRSLIKHGCDLNWREKNGDTLLHLAVQNGNADALELLLKRYRMDPNEENKKGLTPLTSAIQNYNLSCRNINLFKIGQILHDHGAELQDIVDFNGRTLLHTAAMTAISEPTRLLLYFKADVNTKDKMGNIPLHYAVDAIFRKEYPNDIFLIVKLLLEHNADPNIVNDLGYTPFQVSLKNTKIDFETIQLLKSKTEVGWTPSTAHIALIHLLEKGVDGDMEFTSLSLECAEHGVKLDADFRDEEGNSLLHLAAKWQFEKAMTFLVDGLGVDINSRNRAEQTALHHISCVKNKQNDQKIYKHLINMGADVFAKDYHGDTFLHNYLSQSPTPSSSNFHDIVDCLVKMGKYELLETTDRTRFGKTPLHIAVSELELKHETLTLLHSSGVDFNKSDNYGRTILTYAIFKGRETSLSFLSHLIQLGANWKILDDENHNMLHLVAKYGTLEQVEFFIQLGGLDVNGKNCRGNTPLYHADSNKNFDGRKIRRLLVDAAKVAYRMQEEVRSQPSIDACIPPHDWREKMMADYLAYRRQKDTIGAVPDAKPTGPSLEEAARQEVIPAEQEVCEDCHSGRHELVE